MNFKFSFFILIFFCIVPIKTKNNCWDILYSIFSSCYEDEPDNPNTSQINTTTASSSNSLQQIPNSTPNTTSNNSNPLPNVFSSLNSLSSIDFQETTPDRPFDQEDYANANTPPTTSFIPNARSTPSTARSSYSFTQAQLHAFAQDPDYFTSDDFETNRYYLGRPINQNYLQAAAAVPNHWTNSEHIQAHQQQIQDIQDSWQQESFFASNPTYAHQIDTSEDE